MREIGANAGPQKWVMCRVGPRICGVPLACVTETMRVLPITPLADPGGFVNGASIIHGMPVPVIDAGALFGEPPASRRRLVTINVGGRLVALAVDEVLGASEIAEHVLQELPPLLREATADAVHTIGVLDGEFLLCLEASRLIPDAVLNALGLVMPNT